MRVAILLENGPAWAVAFFASVSIGAVLVPINKEAGQEEIENILNDSEPRIVFADRKSFLRKKNNLAALPFIKKVIFSDLEGFTWRPLKEPYVYLYDDFRRKRKIYTAVIKIEPDDTACILYTSGTTSRPKGVMLTHRNIISNCESLYSMKILNERDIILSVLPLHHIYSLTITLVFPLLFGCAIVYPLSMRGEIMAEAMKATNPTVFIAVPQILYMS